MSYFQTFPSEVIMPTTPASYPSDLSEAQWKLVAPLIPVPQSYGRTREYGFREIVNAIFYVLRSGCSWRMLPHDFPPWGTVDHYFRRWSKDRVFEQMNAQLRETFVNGLDAPEKRVRTSWTPYRSRSPTAVGSMTMTGQKNKRSQAAYPCRYTGINAENECSRSEHHRSGRRQTVVIAASKRTFQRQAGLDRHGVQWGRF